jgi:hypothetical protein
VAITDSQARTPFRVPPADPADAIGWPADLGTRAIFFVDTEEEFNWNAPLSRDNRATTAVSAIPDAHRRFADWGAPLTFMVDHPIVSDPRAVEILRTVLTDGVSAVGTQLHPWVNPPFEEAVTSTNSFPGNLPMSLEAAKLDVLTGAITAAFGRAPISYRAGRYGIGPNTLGLLAERGYRLDSSMRSRYAYTMQGGPDFGAIGNAAFWADRARGLIELPLTTVFTGALRGMGAPLYRLVNAIPRGPGLLARAGLLSRVALTPEEMPLHDALEAVRVAAGEGVCILAFSFHSPSLVAGHTPYVRDAADLAAFWAWWDAVFALLVRLGVAPIGLDALIAAADRAR